MAAKMATSKQEKSKKTPNRRCRSCSASAKRPATASPKRTKASPWIAVYLRTRPSGDDEGGRIPEAIRERRSEEGRGPKRSDRNEIEHEEPHRDGGRTGEPDQQSLGEPLVSIHDYLLETPCVRSGRDWGSLCQKMRRLR
jgi:hypothetical protein